MFLGTGRTCLELLPKAVAETGAPLPGRKECPGNMFEATTDPRFLRWHRFLIVSFNAVFCCLLLIAWYCFFCSMYFLLFSHEFHWLGSGTCFPLTLDFEIPGVYCLYLSGWPLVWKWRNKALHVYTGDSFPHSLLPSFPTKGPASYIYNIYICIYIYIVEENQLQQTHHLGMWFRHVTNQSFHPTFFGFQEPTAGEPKKVRGFIGRCDVKPILSTDWLGFLMR